MSKYIYKIVLESMEEIYLKNAGRIFFNTDEERQAFNAELVIEADSPEQSLAMRIGMTDIRMWELDRIED